MEQPHKVVIDCNIELAVQKIEHATMILQHLQQIAETIYPKNVLRYDLSWIGVEDGGS